MPSNGNCISWQMNIIFQTCTQSAVSPRTDGWDARDANDVTFIPPLPLGVYNLLPRFRHSGSLWWTASRALVFFTRSMPHEPEPYISTDLHKRRNRQRDTKQRRLKTLKWGPESSLVSISRVCDYSAPSPYGS